MNTAFPPSTRHHQACRIVVAGAAHIDRTGWLDAASALGCSNPGRFDDLPGGTALNIARILAALQAKPELISLIGNDAAGTWLRGQIEAEGIVTHLGGQTIASTGTYTSVIEPDGSLLVAVADMAIYADFTASAATHVVDSLKPDDWLCVDTNLPSDEVSQLLAASGSKKVGLTVSRAKAARLLQYAPLLDLVFTNRVEACALCGLETGDDGAILAGLKGVGIDTAVISNGADSVLVIEMGNPTSLSVPPVGHVKDVTGAGDALVGACLTALTRGHNLANAVEIGIQAARVTIQHRGALNPDLKSHFDLSSQTD